MLSRCQGRQSRYGVATQTNKPDIHCHSGQHHRFDLHSAKESGQLTVCLGSQFRDVVTIALRRIVFRVSRVIQLAKKRRVRFETLVLTLRLSGAKG